MKYSTRSGAPEKQRDGCVIAGIFEGKQLSKAAARLDAASGGVISRLVERGEIVGKAGQTLQLHGLAGSAAERVLLVGCGKADDLDAAGYRKAVAGAIECLASGAARTAFCCLTELEVKELDTPGKLRAAIEAAAAANYRFEQLKSRPEQGAPALQELVLATPGRRGEGAHRRGVEVGTAIAGGVRLARDLGNLPGNICTPTHLAERARQLRKGRRNIKVTVLEQAQMEKLGMGSLLSVARGSRQPPKLIVIDYRGAGADVQPHVLVGKGITFDSGGISIKSAASMDEMKFDMCGAASVLGTLTAASELALPLNVVGIIPSCENLPDGAANKPGDIVTSMSGQTIEVLNTDAEGRLILCDALTYAERFEPVSVVDIATLTGACVVALGSHAAGLLGNDATLVRQLLDAGRTSGDRAWELPLWEEYQEQLKSNFADMANVGGREAGTITAAAFLARFTKKFRWAHLDIAGVAWKSGVKKGATGRPVPLLVQYLLDRC